MRELYKIFKEALDIAIIVDNDAASCSVGGGTIFSRHYGQGLGILPSMILCYVSVSFVMFAFEPT